MISENAVHSFTLYKHISYLILVAVVKRNKSFTEGDRPIIKKQKSTKDNSTVRMPTTNIFGDEFTNLLSSRATPSSKLSRTKSFSTIDMAKKEGTFNCSAGVTPHTTKGNYIYIYKA